jgi:hypothetical protein
MKTYEIQSIHWTAPSDTREGVVYDLVAYDWNGPIFCRCPSRTTCCKHTKRASKGELGKPRVRITTTPAPVTSGISDEMRDLLTNLDI